MGVFELSVHDVSEAYDELPATLITLKEWWHLYTQGEQPFSIDLYEGVGIRLSDDTHHFLAENFGGLDHMAAGCQALAQRLREGRVGLLRTSTENIGVYLLFSDDDPVRVSLVRELPPGGNDPFPYHPGRSFDPPEASQQLLAWAEAEAERLLAPSDNPGYDQARGLLLRFPRAALIADVTAEAELAEQVIRALWG